MMLLFFYSFPVEHIPTEIRTFISNKNIKANISRTQAYDSIMSGYFCIEFIDYMLAGKTLTEFTNFFSPNNFKRNEDIIQKYFMTNIKKWLNAIPLIMVFLKHLICIQIRMHFL